MESTHPRPDNHFRCSKCRARLGTFARDYLEIRRKDLQLAVAGTASVVCYRCGQLNVATHPKPLPDTGSTMAAPAAL